MLRRRPLTIVATTALLLRRGRDGVRGRHAAGFRHRARGGLRPERGRRRQAGAVVRPRGVQARRGRRPDRAQHRRRPGRARCAERQGYRIGRTIEDAKTRAAVNDEREATAAQEKLAGDLAENGVPQGGAKLEGKSVVPTPGETVIQRANKFTNYAGTFLYVEAHNKATVAGRGLQHRLHRPDAGALVRRCRRRLRRRPTNMGRFIDTDPTPDEYMYHRQLIRLTPRAGRHPGLPDDGPRGRQLRRRRHLQGDRVARHDAAAERRGLPEGLLQPLPGPDREPRPARRAGRAVPEPGHRRSTCRT